MASSHYKLFAVAVLLAVAAAEASIIRKTITTVEETVEEQPNDGDDQMERCREEMRRHQLGSCCSYVQHGSQSRVLAMAAAAGDTEEVPRQCCSELGEMREECRCYKIEEMAREMVQGGGGGGASGEEMGEEMKARAENLPAMCGMGPQRCSIRMTSY